MKTIEPMTMRRFVETLSVILSAAKNLCLLGRCQILRCAQNDYNLAALVFILAMAMPLSAQTVKPRPDGKSDAKPASDNRVKSAELSPADKLAQQQRDIAEQYKRLEAILLRMAELNAQSDPRRAALLKKAVKQSKEQLIDVRFERLIELLGKEQLSRALENQLVLDQDLRSILELLMSENRDKTLENEKARIREYLKQLGTIIRQERDLHGRTLGGDDLKRLAGEQAKIAEKTGKLSDTIKKNEGKGEAKNPDGEGQQSDGGAQNSKRNPAEKRLDQAKQRMQDAENNLKKARQQGAADDEAKAVQELEQAKAELEDILRQLREEEISRLLAMLEARFKKMLQMQTEVYESTGQLDRAPLAERTHNDEIEASRLSSKESAIVVEVDKAVLLLREDGSAVAFPEAVDQMREDMQQIVTRLSQMKVGRITQDIELDVIAALKEMIAALKKAQKDQENKSKQPPSDQPPGANQEPPLIDQLAELKMIRTLQLRVNTRTARYSKLIEGEQAESEELIEALRRLAERQERIHRVTRDLQMGKNQ